MKRLKQILSEITNVSAGSGVRGFGDVSGTPNTPNDPVTNYINHNIETGDSHKDQIMKIIHQYHHSHHVGAHHGVKAKTKVINEEGVAAMGGTTSGGGEIAGLGSTTAGKPANWGEPPVSQAAQKKKTNVLRRMLPEVQTGIFAGSKTIKVPSNIFHQAKVAKRKGKHWLKYMNEKSDLGYAVRQHITKHKGPIIFEDERTGSMFYARYRNK